MSNNENSRGTSLSAKPCRQCVTIRPDREVLTRQQLPYFVGISGATAGTKGLSMHLVVIPPGGVAAPHRHREFETAIYVLEGRVETRYGPGLAESVVNVAGDFLFIPPDLPHQACNPSSTAPARAIVARNDPNEQENVVPYAPGDDPAYPGLLQPPPSGNKQE
jgi:uncharacterized RmlC-like cupin family protein